MRFFPLCLSLLVAAVPAVADPPGRQAPTVNQTYDGKYPSDFHAQMDRVRLLTQQAQLEVSSRLGLFNYREGFNYPLTIKFMDEAPKGIENTLAFVSLSNAGGSFQQFMGINLSLMASRTAEFDTVFYHEMTHAVMNDAVGGEASLMIPHWLQEGLAMYVSGEGEDRVKKAVEPLTKGKVIQLIYDLDAPVTAEAYPQYYLAIKYLLDKYSINAVQSLVRQLIERKPLPAAFLDCTGMSLENFKTALKDYSLRTLKDLARPDSVDSRHFINRF